MSAKPAQSNELREVLARIQTAKANKVNVDKRLRRAKITLEETSAAAIAADAELKESEGLLMGALKKGFPALLKDRDLAFAIAETIANAGDGGSPVGADQQQELPMGSSEADEGGSDGVDVATPKPKAVTSTPAVPVAQPAPERRDDVRTSVTEAASDTESLQDDASHASSNAA